jgi:hypothetical protein
MKKNANEKRKKLFLSRETLEKLELRTDDYLKVAGGSAGTSGVCCTSYP